MLQKRMVFGLQLAISLATLPLAVASVHSGDESPRHSVANVTNFSTYAETGERYATEEKGAQNYFRLIEHSAWIYGHILVMTICWTIILPLCKL
jgi:hypothetical protein